MLWLLLLWLLLLWLLLLLLLWLLLWLLLLLLLLLLLRLWWRGRRCKIHPHAGVLLCRLLLKMMLLRLGM